MRMIWAKLDSPDWILVRNPTFSVNNMHRPYGAKTMVFIDLRDIQL